MIVSEQYIQHVLVNEKLGAGYFGTVYLGLDKELNQKFAIKTVNPEILATTTSGGLPSLEKIQETINTFYKEQKVSSFCCYDPR